MSKRIFITGINGQDGYYLSEYMLSLGHEVHGIIRRNSVAENEASRIDGIKKNLHLYYGDMTDWHSLENAVKEAKPDYVFHLAAQSHVGVSFTMPDYTMEVNNKGTFYLLRACKRYCPKAHIYNAATSEMFGESVDTDGFQRETTPMNPVSPYGVSKLNSYNYIKHYRKLNEMYIANGVCFNHECITTNNPLIIQQNNVIKIMRPSDIRKVREKQANIQQWIFDNLCVWDGESFTKLKAMTATRRPKNDNNFKCQVINTRNGVIETTKHHNLFNTDGCKQRADSFKLGDELLHAEMPCGDIMASITETEAEFLGFMVADGYVSKIGKAKFINNNIDILHRVQCLWSNVALGASKTSKLYKSGYGYCMNITLNGNANYLKFIHPQIYTFDKYKKVPERVLNSSPEIKMAFLRGYNAGDGLKSSPCTYLFKNFKTNSSVLALGLIYLIKNTTNQIFNITFEIKDDLHTYYSINLLSESKKWKEALVKEKITKGFSQRAVCRDTGVSRTVIRKITNGNSVFNESYLKLSSTEIKKIEPINENIDWVYDIETESGKFMCGVGSVVIANSPKRGSAFVTQKVVKAAVAIYRKQQDKLELGNLDSFRDWGHAKDYVQAMWLIANHIKSMDFVIATGKTHSIRDMCKVVFDYVGLNYEDYVVQNSKFMRPKEVPYLKGDSSKARIILGWEPKYTFESLLHEMIESHIN